VPTSAPPPLRHEHDPPRNAPYPQASKSPLARPSDSSTLRLARPLRGFTGTKDPRRHQGSVLFLFGLWRDYASDPVLQRHAVEVDQESQGKVAASQIGRELRVVDGCESIDALLTLRRRIPLQRDRSGDRQRRHPCTGSDTSSGAQRACTVRPSPLPSRAGRRSRGTRSEVPVYLDRSTNDRTSNIICVRGRFIAAVGHSLFSTDPARGLREQGKKKGPWCLLGSLVPVRPARPLGREKGPALGAEALNEGACARRERGLVVAFEFFPRAERGRVLHAIEE